MTFNKENIDKALNIRKQTPNTTIFQSFPKTKIAIGIHEFSVIYEQDNDDESDDDDGAA